MEENNLKDVIKKVIIGILSSSIPFTLLSCSLDKTPLGQRTFLNSSKIIEGKVEFPEKSFNVKATLGEVSPNATVSVIYPPDHPTSPNKTIATGLTNDTGVFSINIDSTFTPANGEIFIIEAEKRMGGVNRDVLTISSYIQFDSASNTWKSMTSPDITINKTTTALSIIASLNTDILNAKETIGKIDISTGSSVPMNIYNTNIYFKQCTKYLE